MKFLKDLDLRGKRILYRVDINSSVKNGVIADDTRIRAIIPTVRAMLSAGVCQIIFLAHQGRGQKRTENTVLDIHAKRLSELLGQKVLKLDSCRPDPIPETTPLIMFENVRLDDECNPDPEKRQAFAEVLASYGDTYVNDAFAACHRDHASITFLPKLMKEKSAGLLLQKEIEAMHPILENKIDYPFTIIIGGAKIGTKIGLIKNFVDKTASFLLGGGVANTFLTAAGHEVGNSLMERDKVILAQEIALTLDGGEENQLYIPTDVVCAEAITENVETVTLPVESVMGNMMILDIGPQTAREYDEIIRGSKTIIWNGPLGFAENKTFRKGSETVARAIAETKAITVVGGGESIAVINMLGIPHDQFTHVSTGGGAMLEYLSGNELPGIKALQ